MSSTSSFKAAHGHGGQGGKVILGCLCAIGCEILYGLSFVFTKNAVGASGTLPLLGWRFLVAFVLFRLCVSFGLVRIDLSGKRLAPLFAPALFFPVLYFIGETVGISLTTASESGIFIASIPAASLLASSLILHKHPTGSQVTGIAATFAGVLITVLSAGMKTDLSVLGYCFLLMAVISYSLYCVFVEKASDFSGAELTYVMLACGAAAYVSLALAGSFMNGGFMRLLTLPLTAPGFLSAILYQGIGCSIFAFFMANVAIAALGVNRTASFTGVATIASIASGVLVLHEDLTPGQVIGSAVIMLGVYIANMKR